MQTISYNNRAAGVPNTILTNRPFPRTAVYRFIKRHADVFEALARIGSPFGGNVARG
jgi:hypothetical protein